MGPNGSGKSTLAQVLAGRELYAVTEGSVTYDGKDLLELSPEERAREGVFLAFQYPVEIPGVSNMYFLQGGAEHHPQAPRHGRVDAMDFLNAGPRKDEDHEDGPDAANRPVNAGFSGGEKKRNEIFQMAVLEPRLAMLDETDSGLDIDALRIVAARRERHAHAGARHDRGDPLPAAAELHRAGLRARAGRGPDREVRRQGTGAGTGGGRLRGPLRREEAVGQV